MIEQEIFSTFILEDNLNLNIEEMNKFAYKLKNEDKGTKMASSSQGGFHSDELNLEEPVLQPLIKAITEISLIYFKKLNIKEAHGLSINNMWFIINKENSYNKPHTHPFSFLSGAFYSKATAKSGDIVFMNPNPKLEAYWHDGAYAGWNKYQSDINTRQSLANKIILFPSWLEHYVTPNQNEEDRIVWSFNLQLT